MNFTKIEDFIEDQGFVASVYKTDEEAVAYWQKWLNEHEDMRSIAEEAAAILISIRIEEQPLTAEQITAAESKLRESIQSERKSSAKIIKGRFTKVWYAAASIVLIAALATAIQLYLNISKPKLATPYGKISQNSLPDGTEVTLNAHSQLTYPKVWKENTDREVWLDGEAFFHVKKTSQHNRFIVHTDAFDIEVTGTSFNVINRNGISNVILKEGHVKIHRKGQPDIIMEPGDEVEFSNKQIQKKIIDKPDYLAWTENKLVFDSTSVTAIASMIKEHYGVEVKLEGEDIGEKTISGMMPNDNLDVLIQSLKVTLDVDIIQSDKTITIINKNQ